MVTISTGPGSEPVDEEVPAAVAVGRTIGGILLVVIGLTLVVAGAFWYFIVPWFGWATEGFWYTMADWADLGGAVVGIGGFVVLIVGGALIQRARKKRLEIFMDRSQLADSGGVLADDTPEETRSGATPPTIL